MSARRPPRATGFAASAAAAILADRDARARSGRVVVERQRSARLPEDRRAPALDGARQRGRAGIVLGGLQQAPRSSFLVCVSSSGLPPARRRARAARAAGRRRRTARAAWQGRSGCPARRWTTSPPRTTAKPNDTGLLLGVDEGAQQSPPRRRVSPAHREHHERGAAEHAEEHGEDAPASAPARRASRSLAPPP